MKTKMRSILPLRKRGVSELISYTLLIILAVSASVLVFNYLKVLTPKDKITCPDGNSLIMTSYNCTYNPAGTSTLNITLSNKGRFTLDGAYIRIGGINKAAKKLVNKNDSIFLIHNDQPGLKPGEENTYSYNFPTIYLNSSAGDYLLEIQPAMVDENTKKFAACTSFVQTITCS
jgi:hypothetical protein